MARSFEIGSIYGNAKRMTSNNGNGSEERSKDFIDPKGYWADLERNIRRTSREQEIVLSATTACTVGEWMFLLDCLGIEGSTRESQSSLPRGRTEF
jgi:hypothetical protein